MEEDLAVFLSHSDRSPRKNGKQSKIKIARPAGSKYKIVAFVALPEKSGMKKPSKFKAFLKLLGFLCVEAMGLEPMTSRV